MKSYYVGISTHNIWNRWFGLNGHIMVGPRYMVGESSVGQKVVDHLPGSWNWKIQLWTFEDCKAFCADELSSSGRYDISWLEPFMIRKLHPALNISYNLNPGKDSMPKTPKDIKREKLLDKAYKKIFEKIRK